MWGLIPALLVWVLLRVHASGGNLMKDPGFEESVPGALPASGVENGIWADISPLPGAVVDGTLARTGKQSLRLDAALGLTFAVPIVRQTVLIPPGETGDGEWRWSFHAYVKEGLPTGVQFQVNFAISDAGGNPLAGSVAVRVDSEMRIGEWVEFSGRFAVAGLDPLGTYTVTANILGLTQGGTGSAYLDDIVVEPVAVPAPPRAVVTGIVRDGLTTRISFGTEAGYRYRLRGAGPGELGMPASGWALIPGEVMGDGTNQSLEEVSAASARFYVVETVPAAAGR